MIENRRPTINRTVQRILTATAVMIGALVLLTAAPAVAQDDPAPVYTRVALWQVDRAQWGDFVEDFEMHDQPVLEKLFNEGVIIEWGLDAMSLHHPEGYTHGTWWSATSMANLEKVLAAYSSGGSTLQIVREERIITVLLQPVDLGYDNIGFDAREEKDSLYTPFEDEPADSIDDQ